MKRFLVTLLVLLVASVAAAQFPEELWGDSLYYPHSVVDIQADMETHRTPWGNFWRQDPEITIFGQLSFPRPDWVMLNLQYVAHHCGTAFWNAGPALEWMILQWDGSLGCFVKVVSDMEDRIVVHTLTFKEDHAVWRSGVLVWQEETYEWVFTPDNYQESIVIPQEIGMDNHSVIDQEPRTLVRRPSGRM
jgi:hypothetical protein